MIKLLKNFLLLVMMGLCSPTAAQKLKVISYNIHHGTNKEGRNTLEEMGEFLKLQKADLVGLQEVDSMCNRSGKVDQMKELAALTGMHYAFARHFAYDGGAYGLGILSRYPLSSVRNDRITSKSKGGDKKSLALLSAKVALPDKSEIHFATVHFALDQPTRLSQSEETLRFLEGDTPVILTGDLNAEPVTKEIERLYGYFIQPNNPEAQTFPVDAPVKKIDFILLDKKFAIKRERAKVGNNITFSDHLPVISKIRLPRRKKRLSKTGIEKIH